MTSTYLPIERVLKVDSNEVHHEENKEESPVIVSSTFVSIGTQCDWKVEPQDSKPCNLSNPDDDDFKEKSQDIPDNMLFDGKNIDDSPLLVKGWTPDICNSDQKLLMSPFHSQYSYNLQTLPADEKFFLQFDYKTRNKLKTKQRRLDPFYRSQERVRQRTVMRIKRQDPLFRAEEREKGRYRMRLKRLDPVFRSQERERQRERMKLKRSNPEFREREREQQKSRMHVKRLDPEYKEKDEHSRLLFKKQNNLAHSVIYPTKNKNSSHNVETNFISQNHSLKTNVELCDSVSEVRSNQVAFPENITSKVLSMKSRDSAIEAFHFKKQHILNFNFYNSIKEEWAAHEELYSKAIAHFGFGNDNETLKAQSSVIETISLLTRDNSEISKKLPLRSEINSETLVNIKSDEVQLTETLKQNAVKDSVSIDRFSLSLCPEK